MDWTLELVVVPVADVDRAKAFYVDRPGSDVIVDHSAGEDFRVVQLVPPGSACAIALLKNQEMKPGSLHGLHLCVSDIEAARAQLVEQGADASELLPLRAAGPAAGPGAGSWELRDVPLVPRPGRQHLADPGSHARRRQRPPA